MCPHRHATKGREEQLLDRTGATLERTGGREYRAALQTSKSCSRDVLVLRVSDAAAATGAIGDLRDQWQAAKLKQELAQLGAVLEIHFHEFKGHGLRASAANDGLGLDTANALHKFQSEE